MDSLIIILETIICGLWVQAQNHMTAKQYGFPSNVNHTTSCLPKR